MSVASLVMGNYYTACLLGLLIIANNVCLLVGVKRQSTGPIMLFLVSFWYLLFAEVGFFVYSQIHFNRSMVVLEAVSFGVLTGKPCCWRNNKYFSVGNKLLMYDTKQSLTVLNYCL